MKELRDIINKYLHAYEPTQTGIITKVNPVVLTHVLHKLMNKIEDNQKELKETSDRAGVVGGRLDTHDSIIKDIDVELERIDIVLRKQYD